MKHLPIKSNDACDSKGITVKWCIQLDYGHLQMASIQENAESFGRPFWHKAWDEKGMFSAISMSSVTSL